MVTVNEKRKTDKVRFGISKKLLLSVALLTILICVVSTLSGYFQYSDTIRRLYNDNGYAIANIILDNIDHDKVGHYAQTWTEDEEYAEIEDYLKGVETSSGAAFIYIVTVSEVVVKHEKQFLFALVFVHYTESHVCAHRVLSQIYK